MSRPPRGHVGLDVAQTSGEILFGVFALDDFTVNTYVENTIDPPPILSLRATVTDRILQDGKIIGVRFELNGQPDTPNYVVRWVLT